MKHIKTQHIANQNVYMQKNLNQNSRNLKTVESQLTFEVLEVETKATYPKLISI